MFYYLSLIYLTYQQATTWFVSCSYQVFLIYSLSSLRSMHIPGIPTFLVSFCVYVPLWYNRMSSVTQIQTYLLPLSHHVFFFPLRTSISLSLPDPSFQPFIFFSSSVHCFQITQYHISTSLHACWGGFYFLSWLPSSVHWNKPSGTSLKRNLWDVNVWLLWSLKVSLSYAQ